MNTSVMFSSKSDEWETPQPLFDALNEKYHFTLDPCCQTYNAKCAKYYTPQDDGLNKDWSNEVVFCNPPYGASIGKWVKKCYDEHLNGTNIVLLVPARTDTRWFHDYIYKQDKVRIEFVKGRLKFLNRLFVNWNDEGDCTPNSAPFPSMLVYFNL